MCISDCSPDVCVSDLRNATAGAIIITTKRPTGDFGLRGQFTLGNFDQREVRVSLEAPLVQDVLAAKLSVLKADRDGFYSNYDGRNLGKKDAFAIRASALFTPSPDLTVYLTGHDRKSTRLHSSH